METCANWEHFEHGADIGVRGYGANPAQAFEQAALALTAVITEPAEVLAVQAVVIHCEAPDIELLFADWLNALVYEMSTRRMLFSRFKVTLCNNRLDATIWGEATDMQRHHPVVEVKGATYTALQVTQEISGCWRAQCVVDV